MKYKLLSLFAIALTVSTVFFTTPGIALVSAQSQEEVNPLFDLSSTDPIYINLNYDCTNIKWSEGAIGIYRKVYKSGDKYYEANPRINEIQQYLNGKPYAETYFLFEGETGLSLEESSINKNDFNATPFNEIKRIAPSPFIIPSDNPEPILKEYVGMPLCDGAYSFSGNDFLAPNQKMRASLDNQNESFGEPKSFVPANFVPPVLQQAENYFVEIIYIFWSIIGLAAVGQLFVIGLKILTSSFSPEQKGATLRSVALWVVGLALAIVAIPLLQFIFRILDIQDTRCFKYTENNELVYDLTVPGFTFFFNDTCTSEESL